MKEQLTITRRGFIEKTIVTGAALGLAPGLLNAAEPAPSFGGRKIRVGQIGCGSVSGAYLPNLTEQGVHRSGQRLRYHPGTGEETRAAIQGSQRLPQHR